MDSTLIGIECIDELAKAHGVGEQVSAVTEAAMRDELDFQKVLPAGHLKRFTTSSGERFTHYT